MKNRYKWLKIMTGGLFAAYLLLTGYLFLCDRAKENLMGDLQETVYWQSGAEGSKSTDQENSNEKVMSTESGEEGKKIALTFDDGPHPIYTPMLLDGLRKRGVKVTFFLMGSAVENYPDIVEQIAEDGHLIGNHTFHHVSLENADNNLIEAEVLSANELIEEVSGQYPQFIRPPFGQCGDQIESETGMICVLWSIDPLDWCTPDASKVVQRVLANARENGIILMHDQYKTSVLAAFTIIDQLQKEGYEFVTVDEILLD